MKREAMAIVVLLALGRAPGAVAANQPPTLPTTSSVAQYVEQLPSARGAVPLGHGSGTVARLAPAARKALAQSGGSDRSTLLNVASNPRYGAPGQAREPRAQTKAAPRAGAPPATHHAATGSTRAPAQPPLSAASAATPNALSAAASTFGASSLWMLAIVLLAITIGSLVLARGQRAR